MMLMIIYSKLTQYVINVDKNIAGFM